MNTIEQELQDQVLQLMRDKRTDQLTGLGNYLAFREYIGNLRKLGCGFSVVLIDMTNLKAANEQLGHFGADALLAKVGSKIRGHDHVFRHGGDEFAVVLPGCPLGGAISVRNRIELDVGLDWLENGMPICAVASACQVTPDVDLDGQLNRCDNALEERKVGIKRDLVRCQ